MNGTEPTRRAPGALRSALEALGLFVIALYLATLVVRAAPLQWDLRAYLEAARAALQGLDPYRLGSLAAEAEGGPARLPFLYPPVALLPFLPLAPLPRAASDVLWIGFNVVLLAGLVALWNRLFARTAGWVAVGLIAVFGWNGAALWALRSGNVALLECALLWAAFACFARGRRAAFATLVVAAAAFKLVPALFLLLLLVPAGGRGPAPLGFWAALGAWAALVWGPFLVPPAAHWGGFLRALPSVSELGAANPSGAALARTLGRAAGLPDSASAALAVAGGLVILAAGTPLLARAWRERDPVRWVMTAVLLDLLLVPRPMAYGFLLLAPAPFHFAPRGLRSRVGALAIALLFSLQGLLSAEHRPPQAAIVVWSPYLLTLALWLLASEDARRVARREAAPTADGA